MPKIEPPKRKEHPVVPVPLRNGVALIGSDGHYWETGKAATAHRAFVRFTRMLHPSVIVYNGDALDGATISRHSRIGWEHRPSLEQELKAVRVRLGEIEKASYDNTRLIWTLGNHDARFNTKLAAMVPEYCNIFGTRLVHHFPAWEPAWAAVLGVGKAKAVVKHRFRSGTHATHLNTLHAGHTIVTGHLHALRITPFTDYQGTRWGVDCGTLSRTDGPQFNYAECNPSNHQAGFVVLQWQNGALLPPEAVYVISERKGLVAFRGKLIKV